MDMNKGLKREREKKKKKSRANCKWQKTSQYQNSLVPVCMHKHKIQDYMYDDIKLFSKEAKLSSWCYIGNINWKNNNNNNMIQTS